MGQPTDLSGAKTTPGDMAFLQVAYGLSDPDLEFKTLNPPGTINPMTDKEASLDVRCSCDGSNNDCQRCGGTGNVFETAPNGRVGRAPKTGGAARPTAKTRSDMRSGRKGFVRCPTCQNEVTTEGLEEHIRKVHTDAQKTKKLSEPEQTCPVGKFQVDKSKLGRHEAAKEPGANRDLEHLEKIVPCKQCGSLLKYGDVRSHMMRFHGRAPRR